MQWLVDQAEPNKVSYVMTVGLLTVGLLTAIYIYQKKNSYIFFIKFELRINSHLKKIYFLINIKLHMAIKILFRFNALDNKKNLQKC